jgi:hypothetical protein
VEIFEGLTFMLLMIKIMIMMMIITIIIYRFICIGRAGRHIGVCVCEREREK